jgi:hypothetical protein
MKKKIIIIVLSLVLGIPIILFALINIFGGAGRKMDQPILQGNISVPTERTFVFKDTSAFQQYLFNHWAKRTPEEWQKDEKVSFKNARIVLGCFLTGQRIDEMNQYIMRQKATGKPGSPWLMNPNGDYDFNAMGFTAVFHLFKDRPDVLYPETKAYLLEHILTIDGDDFTKNVAYTAIEDTENHILMAETSRYLKNKWLWEDGEKSPEFDNKNNGMEEELIQFLEEIDTYGFYEYNSAPYLGYTYSTLLVLNEFAEGEIQTLTRKLLDRLSWQYALGSYKFRHHPPHRRRFGDGHKRNIDSDYHTVMYKVYASLYVDSLNVSISRGQHHALFAAMMSYRPPNKSMEWILEKPHAYFVRLGHGYNSCGEIYSGDRDYLISAGGANQGKRSMIMPKPITLFLDDDATELDEVFHMYGPGEERIDWNNTGVYEDFACTKGKVHIPKGKQPIFTSEDWQVFTISEGIYLNIYSENELGIMAIVRGNSPEEALNTILQQNSDKLLYHTQFNHPNGNFIEYDLNSPKDKWVITKVNKEAINRGFDHWPFFEGNI